MNFPVRLGPFEMEGVEEVRVAAAKCFEKDPHKKPEPKHLDRRNIHWLDLQISRGGNGPKEMWFRQSPFHKITLPGEDRKKAKIPEQATHYAFCYPALPEKPTPDAATAAATAAATPASVDNFINFGGYLYFDFDFKEDWNNFVVKVNSFLPNDDGSKDGLHFGRAQRFPAELLWMLDWEQRFQDIPDELSCFAGAKRLAWVRPSEPDFTNFSHKLAIQSGCFVFEFKDSSRGAGERECRYYPTLRGERQEEPTEEDVANMTESEAWVVVRGETGADVVERLVKFDKNVSFKDNMKEHRDKDKLMKGRVKVTAEKDSILQAKMIEELEAAAKHDDILKAKLIREREAAEKKGPMKEYERGRMDYNKWKTLEHSVQDTTKNPWILVVSKDRDHEGCGGCFQWLGGGCSMQ